jgi:deoxyuridine 5'-triphosphate nucleotidohydrolase
MNFENQTHEDISFFLGCLMSVRNNMQTHRHRLFADCALAFLDFLGETSDVFAAEQLAKAIHNAKPSAIESSWELFKDAGQLSLKDFLAGAVYGGGVISLNTCGQLFMHICFRSEAAADWIVAATNGGLVKRRGEYSVTVEATGPNAFDICDFMKPSLAKRIYSDSLWSDAYSIYGLGSDNKNLSGPDFEYVKLQTDAVPPSKSRSSDSGFDLTAIRIVKEVRNIELNSDIPAGKVVLYGTGIAVAPPHGWYFDLVPRSSVIKTGYLLANNVGVIDQAYRGEIMIALYKYDPSAPDLELPCRIAQIIPRPIMHMEAVEVKELISTERGEGGFGSSGSTQGVGFSRSLL